MSEREMSPEGERAFLRLSVDNETGRLDAARGSINAPFGGWRNTAVEIIAEREGMNPYALDRLLRSEAP